jgi:hypothetical protein
MNFDDETSTRVRNAGHRLSLTLQQNPSLKKFPQ